MDTRTSADGIRESDGRRKKRRALLPILLIILLVVSCFFGAAVPALVAIGSLAIPLLVHRISHRRKAVRPALTTARVGFHILLLLGIAIFIIGGGINQYLDQFRALGGPRLDLDVERRLSVASQILLKFGAILAIGSALTMYVSDRRLQGQ